MTFFHTNIIAHYQQNRYVRLAVYTDLFTFSLSWILYTQLYMWSSAKVLLELFERKWLFINVEAFRWKASKLSDGKKCCINDKTFFVMPITNLFDLKAVELLWKYPLTLIALGFLRVVFFWGRGGWGGDQFDSPPFIFQEELI